MNCKKMIKSVFLFFYLISGSLYSQISFYIKPIVETKANLSFESTLGTGINYKWLENDYFQLKNHQLFTTGNISLGIDVGIIYKQKHYFEIGICGDEAGMKTSLNTYRTFSDPLNGNFANQQRNIHYFTFQMIRFNFNYQVEIVNTKFITGRIQTGINLLFNPNVKGPIHDTYLSPAFGLEPINQENVFVVNKPESFYAYRTRIAPTLSLGIGIDFHSKKHYLFSLGVNYQQGFIKNVIASHTIPVSVNGNLTNYLLYTESRSSGIIFQISRRFQLYPWRPNKKVKSEL